MTRYKYKREWILDWEDWASMTMCCLHRRRSEGCGPAWVMYHSRLRTDFVWYPLYSLYISDYSVDR